eukprot:1734038-Prymnesium_polylepis.1
MSSPALESSRDARTHAHECCAPQSDSFTNRLRQRLGLEPSPAGYRGLAPVVITAAEEAPTAHVAPSG